MNILERKTDMRSGKARGRAYADLNRSSI